MNFLENIMKFSIQSTHHHCFLKRASMATAIVTAIVGGLVGCSASSPISTVDNMPPFSSRGNDNMPPPPRQSATPTKIISTASTVGVQCAYSRNAFNRAAAVNAESKASWSCADGQRSLIANGLPDHDVGAFPNADNPNPILAQNVAARFTLSPALTDTATELGGPRGAIGFMLNGVKIDAGTNGGCNDSGSECDRGRSQGHWRMEALGQNVFKFGTDNNNAHVQPNGSYHYHGMPEGFIAKQGSAMMLIGWAADGFPIYARYGYSVANDVTSTVKAVKSSYRFKAKPDANRPLISVYAMGVFMQDYEYVSGLGDLDECNGRTGATPEFPNGIYHYYATDTYPYLQRCVKGKVKGKVEVSRQSMRS
jgi:hypothetical protein